MAAAALVGAGSNRLRGVCAGMPRQDESSASSAIRACAADWEECVDRRLPLELADACTGDGELRETASLAVATATRGSMLRRSPSHERCGEGVGGKREVSSSVRRAVRIAPECREGMATETAWTCAASTVASWSCRNLPCTGRVAAQHLVASAPRKAVWAGDSSCALNVECRGVVVCAGAGGVGVCGPQWTHGPCKSRHTLQQATEEQTGGPPGGTEKTPQQCTQTTILCAFCRPSYERISVRGTVRGHKEERTRTLFKRRRRLTCVVFQLFTRRRASACAETQHSKRPQTDAHICSLTR